MSKKKQFNRSVIATKHSRRTNIQEETLTVEMSAAPVRVARPPVVAQTENQKRYMAAMRGNFTIIMGLGPAGVGKTYLAGCYAAEQLLSKKVDRVIITRPAEEVGKSLGFLPGTLEEKYEPYLEPFKEVMIERMGKSTYDYELNKSGRIEPRPLGYMRGATFKNAVVIFDEAQNCTPVEMKMFLTRIGHGCKVIINGDVDQCDISGPNGLSDAVKRIGYIPEVKVIEFSESDSVRSEIVKEILKAYRT